jgi:16S rRNA (uracil1498-N3)-methyltransferase
MRHIPRIHITTLLCKGVCVELPPAERHHLLTVFRIQEGAEVRLFNAVYGEWRAHLVDKKKGKLECTECVSPVVSSPDACSAPHLLFPLLKATRLAYLIEKSVELGVGSLRPVITDHTVVASFNKERWQTVAKQATEQCGRLCVPLVHAPEKLEILLETWSAEIPIFAADERRTVPSITSFLEKMPLKTAFLVGPEGGFSVREFTSLERLPFVINVSLGNAILRTETAASVLLTLYAAFH